MSDVVTVRDSNGTAPTKAYHARTVSPPVDVFENADEMLVIADVPGASADSIEVRVENGALFIGAKRPSGSEVEVSFARSFRLPPGIDTAAIQAETKNGTLLVRLPKVAAVKPRKIAVRAA